MDEITVSTEYDGRPRKGKTKKCECCGKVFWAPLHVYERRRFCSRECASRNAGNRIELVCDWCGDKFFRPPSQLRNSRSGLHFCSRECKDFAQALGGIKELHLEHYENVAGSTLSDLIDKYGYYIAKSRVGRSARQMYISHMRRLKKDIACEVCGYNAWVEVCHITPVSEFNKSDAVSDINEINNLVFLCPNHHKEYDLGILDLSCIGR